jgi:hypothetical protein
MPPTAASERPFFNTHGRLHPRNEVCAGGIPSGRRASAPTGATRLFPHRICFALRRAIQPQFQTRHLSAGRTTPPAPGQRHHRIPATRLYSAGLHPIRRRGRSFSSYGNTGGSYSRSGRAALEEQLEKRQTPIHLKETWAILPTAIFMANVWPVTPTRRLKKSRPE